MLSLIAAFLLSSAPAQAEPCPTWNETLPMMVVDVEDYKFFYYPKPVNTNDPNIVLVEKDGELFDTQKVNFWADDMADETSLYNKNIDISCTFGLEFISARYQTPRGLVIDFPRGDCREMAHPTHPLVCDGQPPLPAQ